MYHLFQWRTIFFFFFFSASFGLCLLVKLTKWLFSLWRTFIFSLLTNEIIFHSIHFFVLLCFYFEHVFFSEWKMPFFVSFSLFLFHITHTLLVIARRVSYFVLKQFSNGVHRPLFCRIIFFTALSLTHTHNNIYCHFSWYFSPYGLGASFQLSRCKQKEPLKTNRKILSLVHMLCLNRHSCECFSSMKQTQWQWFWYFYNVYFSLSHFLWQKGKLKSFVEQRNYSYFSLINGKLNQNTE